MGDKNIFKKSSKLFTKDGFYITLFVCLCIVAVAAVYISRNNANTARQMAENQKQIEQQKDNTQPTLVDDGKDKSVPTMQQPNNDKKTSSTSTTKGSTPVKATSSTSTKVKFIMPVEGQITKNYSNDELQQSVSMESDEIVTYWETHEAIDISCDLGTEVKAVADGKVVKVVTDDAPVNGVLKTGMGVTVVIEHSNGIQTAYSCLAEDVKVKEGAAVKKGQVIGVVGNISTRELAEKEGSHLHFAVFKKNKNSYIAVNPLDYLNIKK